MKKIKILYLSEGSLNSDEIKQLKGGEIVNENGPHGCTCTYYDGPSVINDNMYYGCKCECVY
jgi:natural product precursor